MWDVSWGLWVEQDCFGDENAVFNIKGHEEIATWLRFVDLTHRTLPDHLNSHMQGDAWPLELTHAGRWLAT